MWCLPPIILAFGSLKRDCRKLKTIETCSPNNNKNRKTKASHKAIQFEFVWLNQAAESLPTITRKTVFARPPRRGRTRLHACFRSAPPTLSPPPLSSLPASGPPLPTLQPRLLHEVSPRSSHCPRPTTGFRQLPPRPRLPPPPHDPRLSPSGVISLVLSCKHGAAR